MSRGIEGNILEFSNIRKTRLCAIRVQFSIKQIGRLL